VDFSAAAQTDVPQLVELLGMLFTQEAEFSPDAQKQERALRALLADSSRGTIYVAREGEKAIAMASLLYTISTAEGGKAAWFEDLVVHPAHRGRGIGAALLRFVIEQAKKDGVLRITLLTDADNARAQALYRKVGFTPSPMQPMRLHLAPRRSSPA
jgi:GNAT superfamily N-acetyltransferase